MNHSLRLLTATLIILTLSACNGLPQPSSSSVDSPAAAIDSPSRPFEADTLYALLVAEIAGAREQYDVALNNYLQQAHKTRDPQVAARAARLAQYLNAQPIALEASLLWAEIEPDSAEAHYLTAINLAQDGQVNTAFDHMQRVNALDSNHSNFPLIAVASLKLNPPQAKQLLTRFQHALEKQPDNQQLLVGKAILQQQHDPEIALTTIEKALDHDPNNLRALRIQTSILYQLGRGKEAGAIFDHALTENPNDIRLRLQYARQLTKDNLPQARDQFIILLEQTPNNSDILYSLALIDYELKDYTAAEKHFSQLRTLNTRNDDANLYLGLLQEQKNNSETAISFYRLILPSQNYMPAMKAITRIYSTQNKHNELSQLLQQQRDKHPDQAIPLFLLEADSLHQQQRDTQAIALINRALRQYPSEPNLIYSRSLINEQLGHLDRMEADLRTLLELDPDNAAALNALGYVLLNDNHRLSEASTLISKALSLQPKDPAIIDSMGWLLFKKGRNEESLRYLENAHRAYPDAEIAAHLGEALWELGRQKEAREIWQQAFKCQPHNSTLINTLKRLAADLLKP